MAPKFTAKQWVSSHFLLLMLLALVLLPFLEVRAQRLQVTFLDVGQADSILIRTSEHTTILIDAGVDNRVVDELGKQMPFFNKTIDLFVLTHPDRDHHGGVMDILQKYDVKQVMLTGVVSKDPFYDTFLAELEQRAIEIIFPADNRDIHVGQNVYLDIMYPFAGQSFLGQEVQNKNNTSISMRLVRMTGDAAMEPLMLLTGDAEENQEREMLLAGQNMKAKVFKLGHHGSKTSSIAPFFNAIQPMEVVVSAGQDNKFDHPHPEVMERMQGLKIFRTMGNGAIRVEF
jgi:competence protein ComEC